MNPDASHIEFSVRYTSPSADGPLDGRLLLLITTDDKTEPRFQVQPGLKAIQLFGIDVNDLESGQDAIFDDSVFGYPKPRLSDLPAGDYTVQVVFHLYETFTLATGHTVQLPMDRGEGQQWNKAPGNLYSTPKQVTIDPAHPGRLNIELDQVIPPIEPPADTKYIRHIRLKSDLLTEFWGRPMYLGAHVLVPEGFDDHPEAQFPLVVFHGHFPSDFSCF